MANMEASDVVGGEIVADLMAHRRTNLETSSPTEDPVSPHAWFESMFGKIQSKRCHAYCAALDMPSEVLWAAWECLGPPPPPGDDADSDGAHLRQNTSDDRWRVLLEDSTLGSCTACVDAYRQTVDFWDAHAETATTELDEDKAVLAALLRERDDARLEKQSKRCINDLSTDDEGAVSQGGNTTKQRIITTMHEALAFPGALQSITSPKLSDTVAGLLLAASRSEQFGGLKMVADTMTNNNTSLGNSPGAFELLGHPTRRDVRALVTKCFALVGHRAIDELSDATTAVLANWIDTIWRSFEQRQSQAGTTDTASVDMLSKPIAWQSLATALTNMRPQPRFSLLERYPEIIDAALDELSSGNSNERNFSNETSLAVCAAVTITELIGSDAGFYWSANNSDNASSITTVVAVIESCARNAPDSETHSACVSAIGAILYSASFVESSDDGPPSTPTKSITNGTQRAFEFLSNDIPKSPHLFMETIAWTSWRCACDVTRAAYAAGKPPIVTSKFWLKMLTQASAAPPALQSLAPHAAMAQRAASSDRENFRIAAAAATASALRADAAALASIEHLEAFASGDSIPDVDAPGFGEENEDETSQEACDLILSGSYQWEDRDARVLKGLGLTQRLKESHAAAFAARAEVCGNSGAWRCVAATRVSEFASPFLFGNVKTSDRDKSPPDLLHTSGVVLSALLSSACELAVSPSGEKRNARRGDTKVPKIESYFKHRETNCTARQLNRSNDGMEDSQSKTPTVLACTLSVLMAHDIGSVLTQFAEKETYPLARAASPGRAVRNAVAMFLGQRDSLRNVGKALLYAQALGPSSVDTQSSTTGNVDDVWERVCQYPEARAAALEGALLAGKAAGSLIDSNDRLIATAQVVTHVRTLLTQAELAEKREEVEEKTLPSAANPSQKTKQLQMKCRELRKELSQVTWDLVTNVLAEAHESANQLLAQGELIRVFRSVAGVFACWAGREQGGSSDDGEQRKQDRASSLWWVPETLKMASAKKTPAVTRHFTESIDSLFTAMTKKTSNGVEPLFTSKSKFPSTAKSAAKDAFGALLSDTKSDAASVIEFLAKWFPGEAPGNLGAGMLQGLPGSSGEGRMDSRTNQGKGKDTTGNNPRVTQGKGNSTRKSSNVIRIDGESQREYENEIDSHKKQSLRERLVVAQTPSSNVSGGFSSDPLDSWNTDRGGFSEYPVDADEPDVGDEEPDDDFEMVVDDPLERFRSRGLGAAVLDTLSPYDRSLAKARGSGVLERRFVKQKSRATGHPSNTSEILANVRAGGPTHKNKISSCFETFAGRRDFGAHGVLPHDSIQEIRNANRANDQLIRERNELANKRENERAVAKAAREKRLAEKNWEREHVVTLDGAGEELARVVGRVSLAPGHPGPAVGRGGVTYQPANRFGGLRGRFNVPVPARQRPPPPWVVPTLDDLLGVALRWSANVVLQSTHRKAARDDETTPKTPPESFHTSQAYVEHFAPLLFAELKAQVGSTMEEAGGVAPGVPVSGSVESAANRFRERSAFHVVKVALTRTQEGASLSFQENDLVLIEKKGTGGVTDSAGTSSVNSQCQVQRHHAFGVVEGVETGSGGNSKSWSGASVGGLSNTDTSQVCLRIRVCLVEDALPTATRWLTGNGGGVMNTSDERERREGVLRLLQRQGAGVTVSRVSGLTPSLREIAALLATSGAGGFAGASSSFLRPRKIGPAHTLNPQTLKPPPGVDSDQWTSAVLGLNVPQKSAVFAATITDPKSFSDTTRVVLVQGPPGTGKTKVIAATVDAMLAGSCVSSQNGNTSEKSKAKTANGSSRYGAAAVAARQRQDDRRRRLSVDSMGNGRNVGSVSSGNAQGVNSTPLTGSHKTTSQKRRVLVCAQSNSAVDELVGRFAAAFIGTGKKLVRLGREEVVRENALPFLVNRLVEDRRQCETAEVRVNGHATRAPEKKNGSSNHSASSTTSATRARLEKLGEEIRFEESKTSKNTQNASRRPSSSMHLEMLHAQHRQLLGELATLKQVEKRKNEAVQFENAGGSTWSRVVGGADVVCCTLSGAGLLAADHRGKGAMRGGRSATGAGASGVHVQQTSTVASQCAVPLFDAVIIDEAAQATEIATLIPLRWLKPGGACVLVGDPKQLAPTVLSKNDAVMQCLSRSLFERMQLAGHHTHLLSIQYRMHPSIRFFPSNAFYNSKLVDGAGCASNRKSPLGSNYCCIDVKNGTEVRKRSVCNPNEAAVVVAVYTQLARNLRIERNELESSSKKSEAVTHAVRTVGVLTPYRDQMELLRKMFASVLETRDAKFAPLEFATVDGVQGREFDVVLFSCVRSTGYKTSRDGRATVDYSNFDDIPGDNMLSSRQTIGFVGDRRRLNVALTRPKLSLVVVGHCSTLRNADSTWRSLWDDAKKRGLVLESNGRGSFRDALFSFNNASGFGALKVTSESTVPEAVVDLVESSDDAMSDGDDDDVLEISTVTRPNTKSTHVPAAVQKKRPAVASGASNYIPSKRVKTNGVGGSHRVRASVPVASVTSVTRRESKTVTTRMADISARERFAHASARAKATLDSSRGGASGSGGRGPSNLKRVVAPKNNSKNPVGDILRNMRK